MSFIFITVVKIDANGDIISAVPGADFNLQSGGLKDDNVDPAIKVGDSSNPSLDTINKTYAGAINEILAGAGGVVAKRFADGFVPKYKTATSATITAGNIEANGKFYQLALDKTHSMTSLLSGFDLHYIYIDDSASSPPAATIIDSTTEPIWSNSKRGHYNGDDRAIGVVTSHAGAATILYFETIQISSYLIRNIVFRSELGLNMNPNGTWQTPNTNESDVIVPVNAVEISVHLKINRTGASGFGSWASNEFAVAQTDFLLVPRYIRGSGNNEVSAWGYLGASRKIKMAGVDEGTNDFSAWCDGYGYSR